MDKPADQIDPEFRSLFSKIVELSGRSPHADEARSLSDEVMAFVAARQEKLTALKQVEWEVDQLMTSNVYLMSHFGSANDALMEANHLNELRQKEIARIHENCASTLSQVALDLFGDGDEDAGLATTRRAMHHAGQAGAFSAPLNEASSLSMQILTERANKGCFRP